MPNRKRVVTGLVLVPALLLAGAASAGLSATGSASGAAATKVSVHSLPVGDGKVSTTGGRRGYVFRCATPNGQGGAFAQGPWFNGDGSFDLTAKVTVDGAVSWPQASYAVSLAGGVRKISSAGLPLGDTTGSFPVSPGDDAYRYDRNPNSIRAQSLELLLPADPHKGAPSCISGAVGIARNGVVIFDALDASGRDAVANEVQDSCGGHPEITGTYHYHALPQCLTQTRSKRSRLVGFALDGFPIYNGRDEHGERLTNGDLDKCHGRTSRVRLDGERVRTYHYEATREFPYTVGCLRGTP